MFLWWTPAAVLEDGQLVEYLFESSRAGIAGNIYKARAQNLPGMQAALLISSQQGRFSCVRDVYEIQEYEKLLTLVD
jgi:hypothetical protein